MPDDVLGGEYLFLFVCFFNHEMCTGSCNKTKEDLICRLVRIISLFYAISLSSLC